MADRLKWPLGLPIKKASALSGSEHEQEARKDTRRDQPSRRQRLSTSEISESPPHEPADEADEERNAEHLESRAEYAKSQYHHTRFLDLQVVKIAIRYYCVS
jgi:hypothetical protein